MSEPTFIIKIKDFESQVLYFNGMYKLPVAPYPSVAMQAAHESNRLDKSGIPSTKKDAIISRLINIKKILIDELSEVDEIIERTREESYSEIDFLTDMADWLGDIQVYCASEMARLGIPLKETLSIIMNSNFSKLDADGNPIYDDTGKVMKGPFYWKPEPQIKEMLSKFIEENKK